MQSVSSNAVATTLQGYATTGALQNYCPSRLAMKFNVANNSGNIKYYKIGGMCVVNYETLYTLQSRGGELFIISVGHGDGANLQVPKIKRLLDVYTKISGFTYNNGYVYMRVQQYSHECILSQIAGNAVTNITIAETTQAEYNSGTAITIET